VVIVCHAVIVCQSHCMLVLMCVGTVGRVCANFHRQQRSHISQSPVSSDFTVHG